MNVEKTILKEYKRMLRQNPKKAGLIFISCIIEQGKELDVQAEQIKELEAKNEVLKSKLLDELGADNYTKTMIMLGIRLRKP